MVFSLHRRSTGMSTLLTFKIIPNQYFVCINLLTWLFECYSYFLASTWFLNPLSRFQIYRKEPRIHSCKVYIYLNAIHSTNIYPVLDAGCKQKRSSNYPCITKITYFPFWKGIWTTSSTSLLEVLLSYLSFSDISKSIIVDFICLRLTGILNFTRNFCTAQVVELRHPVENEV